MLDEPASELLEAVEAAHARSVEGAGHVLQTLLVELARTGGLGVIDRLAAKRYARE